MNERQLKSQNWYRVGPLVGRIHPGTRVQRQILRGEPWFILSHPVSKRQFRVNQQTYDLIGRLDGRVSMDDLWHGLQERRGDAAPAQDDVISLVARLAKAGVILFSTVPDWSILKQQVQEQRGRVRYGQLNPFSFRLGLFNPGALLDRLAPLQAVIWHWATGLAMLALMAAALLQLSVEWPAIRAHAATSLLTPRSLLIAWLAYPLMKAVHELAHGLAVRNWGGEVREAGVACFLMMPVPYVDASDASAFAGKWQRAAVSSAGIVSELMMATLALFVWLATDSGVVHDTALVVMSIGGLSTVLFNANPLLRYDGYYILCDILELPNLATRSGQWWTRALRVLMKLPAGDAARERGLGARLWIVSYAPAAYVYRLFISFWIVQWIALKSLPLALVVVLWMFYAMLVRPLWRGLGALLGPADTSVKSGRHRLGAGLLTAALALLVCLVPVPASTMVEGVTWLPEQSQVRAGSDARIVELLVGDGQRVGAGDALVVMEEPALAEKRRRLLAQVSAAETEQNDRWRTEPVKGTNANISLERLQQDLAEVDDRIERLVLRAEVDGVFVLPHAGDILGADISQGALVGYVLPDGPTRVRLAIPQDDIGRIRQGVRRIAVRLDEAGAPTQEARMLRIDPDASRSLPSRALGDHGGGGFVTDPADREHLALLEPVYIMDVEIPRQAGARTGGRVRARLDHPALPLADTVLWRFRQLFLRVFTVEAA
jgi:putative peptide zinc metalloprotease protein